MQLTVMPRGPSSRDSVFAQPVTPGRTELLNANCLDGSCAAVRQAERHESNRRCEEELDGFLESLDGHADRRSGRRPAGVPDEDVDAAEGLDRSLDDCLEVAGIRDVAANG